MNFEVVNTRLLRGQILEWTEKTEGGLQDIWRPRFNGSKLAGFILGFMEIVKFKLRKPICKIVVMLWGRDLSEVTREHSIRETKYAHILRNKFGAKISDKRRFKFNKSVYKKLNKTLKADATVICHDRFSAEVVISLSNGTRHLIFDVVELLSSRTRKSLESETNIQMREIKASEKLLTMAKLITVGESVAKKLGRSDDMQAVYNGRPLSHWHDVASDLRDSNLIMFSGSFFPNCGLISLLNVLKYLPSEVHLQLIGKFSSVSYGMEIKQKISQDKLTERVTIINDCDVENVTELLSKGALYIIPFQNDSPNLQVSMPNRVFDAIAAGLPIFVNQGLYLADWVECKKIGRQIDFSAPKQAAEIISSFLSSPKTAELKQTIETVFQETSYESQMSILETYLGMNAASKETS